MSSPYDDDPYEDQYDDYDDQVDDDRNDSICSPRKCGECWGGDGICDKEIEALVDQEESFEAKYVRENTACPHCGVLLTQYEIPTDTLWVWPGKWPNGEYYSQIIALNIFAVYGAPKGEVHQDIAIGTAMIHHVWVGTGEHRSEKLIKLSGRVV